MTINPANQSSYEFGEFRVDLAERVLMRDGELVPLTAKVFDLLLLLAENHGHVVEKERLMREIWPDTFVEEGNLTQNISVLRKDPLGDPYEITQLYRRLGRTDEAFAWLNKACDERSVWMIWLKVDPALDGLRSDPRFAQLMKRVGL